MSDRYYRRRARAKALKADAVILLDRIAAHLMEEGADYQRIMLQIAEMRMRLAPPTGVKAPIVRTGYTKGAATPDPPPAPTAPEKPIRCPECRHPNYLECECLPF